MILYNYIVKDELEKRIIESGTGELFDLETVIPIEILSILELYDNEDGVVTINVRAGTLSFRIIKIQSVEA